MTRSWFVTGSSRGFGRLFVEAALARGDRVAATARDTDALKDLVDRYGDDVTAIALDVTDRGGVFEAVALAHGRLGRLDVVVNNAGYGMFGAVEEVTEDQVRAQMETNFFGALSVTQAALPFLREQGGGHIVQVSSVGGVCAFPSLGAYHASKWALEGLSESLAQEVAGFGIKVTIIEPGPYATDWAGASAVHADALPAYDGLRQAMAKRRSTSTGADPEAAAQALLEIVDSPNPPLRVLFGSMAFDVARGVLQQRLATWSESEALSRGADG